jgi:hypothetical protein
MSIRSAWSSFWRRLWRIEDERLQDDLESAPKPKLDTFVSLPVFESTPLTEQEKQDLMLYGNHFRCPIHGRIEPTEVILTANKNMYCPKCIVRQVELYGMEAVANGMPEGDAIAIESAMREKSVGQG